MIIEFIAKEFVKDVLKANLRPIISDCKDAMKKECKNNFDFSDIKESQDYKNLQYNLNKLKNANKIEKPKKELQNNFDFSDVSELRKNGNRIIKPSNKIEKPKKEFKNNFEF